MPSLDWFFIRIEFNLNLTFNTIFCSSHRPTHYKMQRKNVFCVLKIEICEFFELINISWESTVICWFVMVDMHFFHLFLAISIVPSVFLFLLISSLILFLLAFSFALFFLILSAFTAEIAFPSSMQSAFTQNSNKFQRKFRVIHLKS